MKTSRRFQASTTRICVSFLALFCVPFFAESAWCDSNDDLLDAIMAHQRLYERVRIHYQVMSATLEDGEVVAANDTPALDVVLTVDGDRMRQEETRYASVRTDLKTAVTDGKRVREWRRSINDQTGQGTLMPFDNVAEATFGHRRFYKHKVLNFETMEILEDTGDIVTIQFSAGTNSKAVCRYERAGDYLRLLSYRPYYRQDPNATEWEELTSYFYEYPPQSEAGTEPTGPSEVRQITTSRDSYVLLKVLEVDFNPDIPDGAFELKFPEGAWVKDRNAGARWQITEVLTPGTPQGKAFQPEEEDTSGVRLVCPSCARDFQSATGAPTVHCPACDAVFALDW